MNALSELPGRAGAVTRAAVFLTGAVLLVFTILLVSDTLLDQILHIEGDPKSILLSISYLLFPAAVSLGVIVLAFRCKDDRALTKVALALLAVSVVSRLVWISVFDAYQVNDFGYYLQCGADVVRNGTPLGSHFCEGPYWKRTVFYTLPLVRAFGLSLFALKLANVLLTTLSSWIFFLGCRVSFGARVATIALVFFVWNPDLWYSITLASHDIPGLLWLAIFYYLCALLQRDLARPAGGISRPTALSVCLGGALFFLDFSRSYHIGAILALGLYTLVHVTSLAISSSKQRAFPEASAAPAFWRGSGTRQRLGTAAIHAALLIVIPLAVYRIASAGFWRISPEKPGYGETGLTCYLSVMDVLGTSNYEEINNWYDRQCPLIKGREKTVFAVRKVLHDMTNSPREFLLHLERKNCVLGHADDYIEWSTYTSPEPWDTTSNQVRRLNLRRINEQYRMVGFAEIALLVLVLIRLLLYPALRFRAAEFIAICFSCAYFLMFLVLVESQPRYDIFLIFPFSWMAAQAVDELRHRSVNSVAIPPPRSRLRIYLSGAIVLVLLTAVYWGVAILLADGPLTLRNQAGFARVPRDEVVAEARQYLQVAPVFVRNNHKQLMLAYPPGSAIEQGSILAVQRSFKLQERKSRHLRFFISNYSVREEPFDKTITWEDTDLLYLIAINGKIIAEGNVNDIPDNRYFSLTPRDGIEFAPKMTIQLIIRNTERIERVEPDRGPILSLEYVDLQ